MDPHLTRSVSPPEDWTPLHSVTYPQQNSRIYTPLKILLTLLSFDNVVRVMRDPLPQVVSLIVPISGTTLVRVVRGSYRSTGHPNLVTISPSHSCTPISILIPSLVHPGTSGNLKIPFDNLSKLVLLLYYPKCKISIENDGTSLRDTPLFISTPLSIL